MGRRQRAAIWLAKHGMPTFAAWVYKYWMYRFGTPQFVGSLPPRTNYDIGSGPRCPHGFLPAHCDVMSKMGYR